jgi:hypothetical protein
MVAIDAAWQLVTKMRAKKQGRKVHIILSLLCGVFEKPLYEFGV